MGSSGVEPPTSCLSGMRSNLLSYEPVLFAQSPESPLSESVSLNLWFRFFNRWWRWRDSNPWPPACRAGALPTELHPHNGIVFNHTFLKKVQQSKFSLTVVPENRTTTLSRTLFFVVCLFLCELRVIFFQSLMFSIERRWSSRTFRYGYLVTT